MRTAIRFGSLVAASVVFLLATSELQAEYRIWTASAGGYTIEAEFVELAAGDIVKLKLKSGDGRDVPLDRLSAADREYVRNRTAPGGKSERLLRVEREAERCRSARDALRIYKLLAESADAAPADKAAVAPKIAELEPLAEKNLFRIGGKWITEEEAGQIRKRANELMKQGFEVLKLGQEDTFRKKFAEAAALEPEEVRADFLLAVLYSSSNRNKNITRAIQHYETCLKRDPTNTAVQNNLALLRMKNGDYRGALDLWKLAMQASPDQRICQNIGKLVKAAGYQAATVPKPILDQLTDLYLSHIGEGKLKPTDEGRGWLHLLIDDAALDLDLDKTTQVSAVVPPPSDEGPVVGGGTGFVVAPQYLVTNAHVVEGSSTVEIQTADGSREKTLKATVVATSKTPDLALLRCTELFAPAVTFDQAPCRRGTDVMVLGYPEMFELGATLKATRGVISGLPSPALDNLYLYDAVTNGGNSGGPVCDSHANIVAVHCIGVNTASRYGGGIPSAEVVAFLQKSLPGYKAGTPATKTIDWPAVDQQVSPSTVLVWVRKRDGQNATAISGALEDKSCLACKGAGGVKCFNGGCVNGVMTVRVRGTSVKAPCPICSGTGLSKCLHCVGSGVDRDVLAAAAAKDDASGTTSTPGGGAKPAGDAEQTHSPLSKAVIDLINVAVAQNRIEEREYAGSRKGGLFREAPTSPGILIGFDLTLRDFGGEPYIGAMRPIFLTGAGKQVGRWHGTPQGEVTHAEAPPQHTIASMKVYFNLKADYSMSGVRMEYVKYDDAAGLLTQGSTSVIYGTRSDEEFSTIPSSPRRGFIIGLTGETTGSTPDVLNGLGVIVIPKTPSASTTTTTTTRPPRPNQPDLALVNKVASVTIPSDRDVRHPPLPSELADYIKDAVANSKTVDVGDANFSGDAVFRTVPTDGGLLIGFDLTYGRFVNTPLVQAIRPIFLTRKGKIAGPVAGVGGSGGVHVEAKPGYAIGRMYCKSGLYLNTITITYMKITPTGLDPNDSYEGACYGGDGGSGRDMIGGGGTMIVGLIGSAEPQGGLRRLAGVTLAPKPTNP
jgi:S1-C subfamily serine protease